MNNPADQEFCVAREALEDVTKAVQGADCEGRKIDVLGGGVDGHAASESRDR